MSKFTPSAALLWFLILDPLGNIPVFNNTGSAATLCGWIDFDLKATFSNTPWMLPGLAWWQLRQTCGIVGLAAGAGACAHAALLNAGRTKRASTLAAGGR